MMCCGGWLVDDQTENEWQQLNAASLLYGKKARSPRRAHSPPHILSTGDSRYPRIRNTGIHTPGQDIPLFSQLNRRSIIHVIQSRMNYFQVSFLDDTRSTTFFKASESLDKVFENLQPIILSPPSSGWVRKMDCSVFALSGSSKLLRNVWWVMYGEG